MRKASNTSTSNDSSPNNDPDLKFSIGASEIWEFDVYLSVTSASDTPDIDIGFTVPAGATIRWGGIGPRLGAASSEDGNGNFPSLTGSNTATFGVTDGGAGAVIIHLKGVVVNSTTAGTVQLQWAQDVSSGTATTVQANSYLRAGKF